MRCWIVDLLTPWPHSLSSSCYVKLCKSIVKSFSDHKQINSAKINRESMSIPRLMCWVKNINDHIECMEYIVPQYTFCQQKVKQYNIICVTIFILLCHYILLATLVLFILYWAVQWTLTLTSIFDPQPDWQHWIPGETLITLTKLGLVHLATYEKTELRMNHLVPVLKHWSWSPVLMTFSVFALFLHLLSLPFCPFLLTPLAQ